MAESFDHVLELLSKFWNFKLVSEVLEKVSGQTLIPKLVSDFRNSFERHLYSILYEKEDKDILEFMDLHIN